MSLLLLGSLNAVSDSLSYMTLRAYHAMVLENHPLARQAATLPEEAQSVLRMARGGFDPQVNSGIDQKQLNGKEYWNIWQSKLEIPVWTGADIRVAYDNNTGSELDPSLQTPAGGLSYVGLTVPIGQGLLIDQRRATLRQAQLAIEAADADMVRMINRLLLQAAVDFCNWNFTYERYLLHEEALRLAEIRFRAVRDRVLFGDLPAVDSLEAWIEVQNRQNVLTQSRVERDNARFIAANHLWSDLGDPVVPGVGVVPSIDSTDLQAISDEEYSLLLLDVQEDHPDLLKLDVRLGQLEIDRRLASEKLRPKLNLDYNFLRPGNSPWDLNDPSLRFNDNYKAGLRFSMPLFLREERGKLGVTRLKIRQTSYERQQAERELSTGVQNVRNELTALGEQINIQTTQVDFGRQLLEAEQFRFNNGEGSVFLINVRENTLISSRIRLAELRSRYASTRIRMYWAAGNLMSMSVR
jgi:outer membrane protein TolC